MASGGNFGNAAVDAFDANLLGVFQLEEASGSRANEVVAGSGPLLEFNGPVGSAAGINNDAADFDNVNREHFALDGVDWFRNLTSATFSIWLNLNTVNGTRIPFWEEGGSGGIARLGMFFQSTGKVGFQIRTNVGTETKLEAGTTLATGTWYNITGTCDASDETMQLWVNNSKIIDTTATAFTNLEDTAAGRGLILGGYATVMRTIDGLLDHVCLWDVKISDTAVAALYNSGAGTFWILGGHPTGHPTMMRTGGIPGMRLRPVMARSW